jgi:hypothetical protein
MNDTQLATGGTRSPDNPPVVGGAIECDFACAMCMGTGRIDDLPCSTCEGSGFGEYDMQRERDHGDETLSPAALIGMAAPFRSALRDSGRSSLRHFYRTMTPQAIRSPAAPDGWE